MSSDYANEARVLIRARPAFCREIYRQIDDSRTPSGAGLTRRQRDLLVYLRRYIKTNGFAPSFDEMKDAIGLASKSGIHRMVLGLEERGYIARLPDRARAITLKAQAA